jgi:glutamate-1-semialdehyde 2,1-aminomutase
MKPSRLDQSRSKRFFQAALRIIPGGVNSPVRAFRAVRGTPFFVARAKGSLLTDVDGNRYIDYVCTWGPSILGHAHPAILRAISRQLAKGISFGAPHPAELDMARLVTRFYPSVQKVRMCNSGTEATMACVRLARGFTGRNRIIKFDGCYHGHVDSLLVKAGSGALTFGQPDSRGIPPSLASLTTVLPFNNEEAVRHAVRRWKNEIAAVILEPIPANAGLYLPRPDYLEFLRKITHQHGIALIFDEVMTGFRVAPGGVQQLYGIRPDLTALGKIIGGGLPVGAFGGRSEIMDCLAPVGPVYQAGTLSGNPLAMAAGIANVEQLTCGKATLSGNYALLDQRGHALVDGLRNLARRNNVPVQTQQIGSMICLFFTNRPVHNLDDAKTSDTQRFGRFFHAMLTQGVYFPPSQFETAFLSTEHSEANIEATLRAAAKAFKQV